MQIAIIAFVAFVIAALSGYWLIPALIKLHFGQSILEIGPNWHKNKEGTPTMGGIMFVIGILAASCLAFLFLADAPATEKIKYGSGLVMALGYGLLGFIDDYTKIARKQNEGLTAKQKLIGQVLLAIMFLVTSAVSICGPIGFISLGVPNLSRILCKSTDIRKHYLISSLMGVGLLLVTYLVATHVNFGIYLPISATMAVIALPLMAIPFLKKS